MKINIDYTKILPKSVKLYIFFELMSALNPNDKAKLTPSELRLLTGFAMLPAKHRFHRFSSISKKKVLKILKEEYNWEITNLNINHKIYGLIDKGYLFRDEDNVVYFSKSISKMLDSLVESTKENPFQFEINFSTTDDV